MSDEELKRFMEYFKDELPDPEHYPQKENTDINSN